MGHSGRPIYGEAGPYANSSAAETQTPLFFGSHLDNMVFLHEENLTGRLNCTDMFQKNSSIPFVTGNYFNMSACSPAGVAPQSNILPLFMVFGEEHIVSLITYSIMFVIAALGNLTVFFTLFRNRHRRSRVNMFIMHLSVADMIVTFIMVPMEIGWHATVYWRAGDVACRILMFFRTFGFYLSAFILITISLDRYFAILHPLSLHDAEKRGKIMIALAWICSTIASIPQSVIFHVESYPNFEWFTQCVTMNFFPTMAHELAYNLFNVLALYGVPLVVIVTCYSLILWEVTKKARESRVELSDVREHLRKRGFVRRSGTGTLEKARVRTLKMTIVIVVCFILCWTPYFVLSAWWWIDSDSAKTIDKRVQRWIFTLAVSNSCVDPIVYGMFTLNLFRDINRWCCPTGRKDVRGANNTQLPRYYTFRTSSTRSSEFARDQRAPQDTTATPVSQPRGRDLVLISDLQGQRNYVPLKRTPTPPHIARGMGNEQGAKGILFL